MDGGKKPSSPLSPPNLMVAANAGLTMRTVAPTTAAYSVKKRKGRIGQSLFRMITSRDFFCSERSSLLLTSPSRFSSSSKKNLSPFFCASSFVFLKFDRPSPFPCTFLQIFALNARGEKPIVNAFNDVRYEAIHFRDLFMRAFFLFSRGHKSRNTRKRGPIEFFLFSSLP